MECKCPRGRLHSQQCPWYHPDVINVPDIGNNLSTSEQAAQGKIYDMYQNTQNGQQELCGCGTAAEIAYLVTSQPVKSSNGYMREVPMRCCWLF